MKVLMAGALTWALAFLPHQSFAQSTRGKALYMANCISCHNKDPRKKGGLGPELYGVPLAVMQMKISTGNQYPAGYVPKRKTKMMKKFPSLAKEIPLIHAWINSATGHH